MRRVLSILFLLSASLFAIAQQKIVTGTVQDDTGAPLPGAAVFIRSSNISTITDAEGRFSLSAEHKLPFTLAVSFVGHRSYELEIYEIPDEPVAVTLLSGDLLDEVVVIGYGVQRKREVTGAIASVSGKDFNKGLVQAADQLFAGRVTGVQITQSSNQPGGGSTIRIRGANSINASNEPLYVIDGLPINNQSVTPGAATVNDPAPRNPLNSLNPNDIESVEVLKDASATAIYGSRGANGVIIITTKKGGADRLNVDYSVSTGVSQVASEVKVLNADQYMAFLNDIRADQNQAPEFTEEQIANSASTDWQKEVFRTAGFQNHQLTLSGGRDNLSFYSGFNYVDQDGNVLNSGIKKYIARINVAYQGEKFNMGVNLNSSLVKDQFAPSGVSINESAGVIYSSLYQDPTLPVYNADGTYGITRIVNLENPYALTQEVNDNASTLRIFGNVFGEYHFTPEFSAKLNLGTDLQQSRRDAYVSRLLKRGEGTRGIADVRSNEGGNNLIELTARYNKTIGEHQFEILGGYTYQEFEYRTLTAGAQNFPLDALQTDNLAAGAQNTFTLATNHTRNQLQSYLGRVNYNYRERYLLTASIRADGSSRFGANNKFGYFPSAAIGWRLSEESFLLPVKVLSELKLRLSYGQTGSQEIGDYNSQILFGPQGTAVLGGASQVGISAIQLPNPDLKWETTSQFNAGIDFGFFDGRLTGAIDYFVKNTDDLLLNLPIPRTTGFSTKLTNIGSMKNSGFELSLTSQNVVNKNFEWSTTFNISTVKNEVTGIGDLPFILGGSAGFISDFTIIRKGDPLNSYYGYVVDGVFQLDDDIASSAQPLARPGEYKYKDVNNDGRINADDRTILGSPFPNYTFGFNNDFKYGPFTLAIFFQGVQGGTIFNMNRTESENPISFRRNRLEIAYTDRWTPENPTNANSSSVPVAVSYASNVNSRAVEDASYIRLRSVQLGFHVPIPERWKVRSAQLFVTGQNLFTITDYTGYDPEVSAFGTSNVRADFNAYPLTRTFSIGATIGL
ncbi:TonB-dependent receptor [Chryseolinea sp. T2]|uniref:SusC/RagA family TonB-linked outer membrane protein n=1 Tax=Chryseolinea sp. T2 TaxID=3129255 RepID=UPI003076D40E